MYFNNKVAFITGAGSGIGKATSLHFAKHSALLSLIDINKEALLQVAEECKISCSNVLVTVVNVTKDNEVKEAIDKTLKVYGKIDVVVNCAGILRIGNILNRNILEDLDKSIAVNLRAPAAVTAYSAPALIESKGCIINISSVAANFVTPDYLVYNVAKAGLSHFTKSVAVELASKGVRAVNVLPGAVKTNVFSNAGFSEQECEDIFKSFAAASPFKKLVDVDDVAELIIFLASDKAKSITGCDFVIDAGILLSGPHKYE